MFEDDTLSEIIKADVMASVRENAIRNVGVNPDQEAELQRKADTLGISPDEARVVTPVELDKMLAERFVANLDLPLATRKLLANDQLSRLVATTPQAYESLSTVDQLVSRFGKGLAQGTVSDANRYTGGPEEPLAAYDVDAEEGADFTFLKKWAARADSPLMQDIQDRIRESSYEIASANYDLRQYATPVAMQEIAEAETVGEALGIALSNPVDVILGTGLESIGAMGMTLPITAAAYAVNPALGALSMGIASAGVEYGASLNEAMIEAGVDVTDPASIRKALNDPVFMRGAVSKSLKRSFAVGSFDTLAGFIAPARLSPATSAIAAVKAAKGRLTGTGLTVAQARKDIARTPLQQELENVVSQMVVGGALGGAGEAAGQLSAEGKITSISDIVLESIADLATAPVDVLVARADARKFAVTEKARAVSAKQDAQVLMEVLAQSKTNELNQRAPQAYQQFLNDAAEGRGIGALSASVQTLKELGVYEALLEAAPNLRPQAALAEATGGDLDIRLGDLSALNDASPDAANKVVSVVRTKPDGMSLLEAQEFDAEAGAQLSETAQRLMQEEADAMVVDAGLRSQVNRAAKEIERAANAYFDPEQAKAATTLQKSIIYSLSKRLGIAPKDLLTLNGNRLTFDIAARMHGFKGVRGRYAPGTNTVQVFRTGDVRTFTHEMAHFWLESLASIAQGLYANGTQATPEMQMTLDALDGVITWLGGKGDTAQARLEDFRSFSGDKLKNAHEKFAEGFETYITKGEAPSMSLIRAFEMMKQWIKDSWKFFGITREELSPEVLGFYDTLFFADQEAADAAAGSYRLSKERSAILKESLTSEEYAAYMSAQEAYIGEASTEVGVAVAENKKLINSRREREARGIEVEYKNILKEETEKVRASRPYQTLAALTASKNREDGIHFKIEAVSAKAMLTPEAYEFALARGWLRRQGQNMLSAADAAELLGYTTPQELVDEAISAFNTPPETLAKPNADKIFVEIYGEAATPAGIARLATNAIYNGTRILMLATEFKALKKINSPVRSLVSAARAFAKDILSGRKALSLKPRKYQQAAVRARKAADRALAKGNLEAAAEYTRAEMLQTAMANEAARTLKRIDQFHKRLKNATKSKAIDFAHRDQLINIAVQYGFISSKRLKTVAAPSLSEFLKANGYDVELGMDGVPTGVTADDLTVEQYEQMMDVVDMLIARGRAKHTADKSQAKGSVNQRKVELNNTAKTSAESMGREARKAVVTETRPWMKAKDTFVGFFHTHIKMSTWARILDGNKFGAWFEYIIKPANKLSDKETKWNSELTKKLDDILKPFFEGNPNGDWVEIDGVRYNLQQRFVIALNAGNEVNLQRIMDGNGFTREQIGKIMASLTDGQLAAVQRIWDLFESLRPEIAKLEYRLNGKEPNWTEPVPIEVERPDGSKVTLRGGHYPITYDYTSPGAASSAIARDMENAEKAALEGGHTGTTTTRTYTKDRSDKGLGIPVSTALEPLFSKLQEVVHDLTWREFLLDMQRLRADSKAEDGTVIPGITSTISAYYGASAAKQFDAWLQNIAYGNRRPPSGSLDQFASRLRRGVSISGLGFNIVSAAVQITGLIPAMTRLGVGGVASAVSDYFGNVRDNTVSIAAKSDFMANRARTFLRELDEINNRIEGGQSKAAKALRGLQDSAYVFMAFVQNHIDRIVWLGAYKKATLEGLSEEDCVARADQTVRDTQGSGLLADMSAAEMGSLAKLFTSFYSFMNTAYNLNAAALLGEKDRYNAAGNILTVSVALPIIEGFLRSALAPGSDDDDDKEWTKYAREAAGNVVNFNLGLLVFTREMSSMAGNFVAGEPVFTWRGPSSLRVISDIGQVISQSAQGEFDKALVKSIVNAAGATFALPAAQVNRTIDGFDALIVEEKTNDPTVLIRGYKEN